jgi:hypothetical protein
MIDTIAEAMSRLEEDRSQLKSYELAHAAIGKFERTYRRYAGARIRSFAREVSAARTKFEEASAEVNKAAAQLASALHESTAAEAANLTAKREAEAADAAYKGILQHPDGLKAADLATKRHLAEEAEERLTASEKRSATRTLRHMGEIPRHLHRWDGKTRSRMEEPARLMLNRSA